ncbi:hypothetical protein A8H31_03860 [Burkholderia thailandensis]|nr:hypothetical protein A8H31_03860 [Burkholderia thailandensis]
MSLVSSICVMQSHERDDRHSRTHPVRTAAKHQNGHISSGRGNEKAREAFTLRATISAGNVASATINGDGRLPHGRRVLVERINAFHELCVNVPRLRQHLLNQISIKYRDMHPPRRHPVPNRISEFAKCLVALLPKLLKYFKRRMVTPEHFVIRFGHCSSIR